MEFQIKLYLKIVIKRNEKDSNSFIYFFRAKKSTVFKAKFVLVP